MHIILNRLLEGKRFMTNTKDTTRQEIVFTFIVDQHFSFPTKPMLLPLTSVPDYSSFPSDEICFGMQNTLSKNAVIVKHTKN